MGLLKTVSLNNGMVVESAYLRIDYLSGNKEKMQIMVNSYKDQSSYVGGLAFLEQKQYFFKPSVDGNSTNFVKQGYEFLKTLPEFSDAVDLI